MNPMNPMNPLDPVDMSTREIRIPLDEVVAIFQDLDEFAVSPRSTPCATKDASTAPSAL